MDVWEGAARLPKGAFLACAAWSPRESAAASRSSQCRTGALRRLSCSADLWVCALLVVGRRRKIWICDV